MIEKVGKITSTQLGFEDHGIMTCFLMFDFGGTGQGFGGYGLDDYDKAEEKRIGVAAGMDMVMGIINACGISNWEEIEGKTMYALYEDDKRRQQPIIGIRALPFEQGGTFLIKEWQQKWFPEEGGD